APVTNGGQTATIIAALKNGRQTATIIAAAEENDNTPTAITAPKADAGQGDVGHGREPVETTGAQLMEPTSPPDGGEPRERHDDAEVLSGASKPAADVRAINSGDAPVSSADRELVPGPVATDAKFYRERGIAAYRSGDFLGAIGNFNEAIRLNPA